jgi:hypothetical protein
VWEGRKTLTRRSTFRHVISRGFRFPTLPLLPMSRYALEQGKRTAHEKRKHFQSRKTGYFARHLDKALPGKHTRKLYNKLSRPEAVLLAQVRTGYCRLNDYLHSINATENNRCECGARETVRHFLLECKKWEQDRRQLQRRVRQRGDDLAFLLGAYTSEAKDGPMDKWSPNTNTVRETISFIRKTGRLELGTA